MKKWDVNVTFTIQAPDRHNAFIEANEVIAKHLRNIADLNSVHELTNTEAKDVIAVNEPIGSKS